MTLLARRDADYEVLDSITCLVKLIVILYCKSENKTYRLFILINVLVLPAWNAAFPLQKNLRRRNKLSYYKNQRDNQTKFIEAVIALEVFQSHKYKNLHIL